MNYCAFDTISVVYNKNTPYYDFISQQPKKSKKQKKKITSFAFLMEPINNVISRRNLAGTRVRRGHAENSTQSLT